MMFLGAKDLSKRKHESSSAHVSQLMNMHLVIGMETLIYATLLMLSKGGNTHDT